MSMKHVISALCCVCAVAAVSAAQSGSTTKEKARADVKKGVVTVTGCVAASAEPGHYLLTNVVKPGETGGRAVSYALIGGDLKPHVGHKVEVAGTMDTPASKKSMGSDKMAKPAARKGAMANGQEVMGHDTLHVQSVKMLAAACS
jgi:hypothetical protein